MDISRIIATNRLNYDMVNIECPKCREPKLWSIRRGKIRCSFCRYEWKPNSLPLYLNREEWKVILKRFLGEQSGIQISHETDIHRQRVLRAVNYIRKAMQSHTPEYLFNDVVIDIIDLKSLTESKGILSQVSSLGVSHLKEKSEIFVLLALSGQVWIRIVPELNYKTFTSIISERVNPNYCFYFNPHKFPKNISVRGSIRKPVFSRSGKYIGVDAKYMNEIEEFWINLNHNLTSKRGVSKDKLPLHIWEYVWRYNHQNISSNNQIISLLSLLENLNLNKQ